MIFGFWFLVYCIEGKLRFKRVGGCLGLYSEFWVFGFVFIIFLYEGFIFFGK